MQINIDIRPGLRVRAFYLAFIISSIQTGVGIMSAPHAIGTIAKQDAWISVLIAAIAAHVVMFVMFRILRKYKNADILGIHKDVFGEYLGKLLGTVYLVYIFAALVSITSQYITVVQVFVFSDLESWVLASVLGLLIIYAGLGGIRVIVGVTVIFYFLSIWLIIFLYTPVSYMEMGNFLPILQASPQELLLGARESAFSFIGMEIMFFIYPFLDNKEKAIVPAQVGIGITTFLLMLVMVISIGYFPQKALETLLWPVLVLFKIVEYPFIERFDVLVVMEWMMVVLPNMILMTWIIIHSLKRMYKLKQKHSLFIVVGLLVIACSFLNDRFQITKLIEEVGKVGFWVAFVYPLILLPLVSLKQYIAKKRRSG